MRSRLFNPVTVIMSSCACKCPAIGAQDRQQANSYFNETPSRAGGAARRPDSSTRHLCTLAVTA